MARPTYPRSDRHHAIAARSILDRHARQTGRPVELPVPIEFIVEATYNLEMLTEPIDEPPDTVILGALRPERQRIVLNERHEAMFQRWIGPERFTLAHELAHWVYDAENPDQLALDFEQSAAEHFCYHRESPRLTRTLWLREVNANKLAAHVLLPEHLVRAQDADCVLADFRRTAADWGVSQTTLRIRLQDLGLIDDDDRLRLNLP